MGDETQKATLRAAITVIALVFAIVAAAVDNGIFTWKVDQSQVANLYWERSCIQASPCFNGPNWNSSGSIPPNTNCTWCDACQQKCLSDIHCNPDDCFKNVPGTDKPDEDCLPAFATCLDLSANGWGSNGHGQFTVPPYAEVKEFDCKIGIFRSSCFGKSGTTFDAIDGLSRAAMLCEDYKEAVRAAQAWCVIVAISLGLLAINHGLTVAGFEVYGLTAAYGVAFLHFCATFLSLLSTVWPAIFFQTLEPCEFNYHTLKQEEGAKIGINQYLFTITTLCQFVVLGLGAGIPPMDAPPPKVAKYVPVPQRVAQ